MKVVREVFLVETMMEEIARGPEPEPGIESSGDEGMILRDQLGTLEGNGKVLKGTHVDVSALSSVRLEGLKLQNQCPDSALRQGHSVDCGFREHEEQWTKPGLGRQRGNWR